MWLLFLQPQLRPLTTGDATHNSHPHCRWKETMAHHCHLWTSMTARHRSRAATTTIVNKQCQHPATWLRNHAQHPRALSHKHLPPPLRPNKPLAAQGQGWTTTSTPGNECPPAATYAQHNMCWLHVEYSWPTTTAYGCFQWYDSMSMVWVHSLGMVQFHVHGMIPFPWYGTVPSLWYDSNPLVSYDSDAICDKEILKVLQIGRVVDRSGWHIAWMSLEHLLSCSLMQEFQLHLFILLPMS